MGGAFGLLQLSLSTIVVAWLTAVDFRPGAPTPHSEHPPPTHIGESPGGSMGTMKALVYRGTDDLGIEERPQPTITSPTDAIIKLSKTSICSTDLAIASGAVPSVAHGRILGHEGVGVVESVGAAVRSFAPGDRVVISSVTACGTCQSCWRSMPSHCDAGGWLLGHTVDGTQAEYVRVPFADMGLHKAPRAVDEGALVMVSDLLPTALECGAMNGKIVPGATVAIVGAGPLGLAALMTAQLHSPAKAIVIDADKNRLAAARKLGATDLVMSKHDGRKEVLDITGGKGVNTSINATGSAQTLELCLKVTSPGGTVAHIGAHAGETDSRLATATDGHGAVSTRLVDGVTSYMLIGLIQAGKINAKALATHRYKFKNILHAYSFVSSPDSNMLKAIIEFD